jgi:G3E family GTPase
MAGKDKAKLIVVGGFLGSGKTTLMITLGKRLTSAYGKRVAMITNDQGEVLVDTETVKNFGFECAEVLSGCFCCRFPEFIRSIHEFLTKIKPDIILAEPVGSCTDLLATVYAPLRHYYKGKISLAPYIVLVDASTILEFNQKFGIASPRTSEGYLCSWQLQEADIIGINKVDLVSEEKIANAKKLLRKVNEKAEMIEISAKTSYNIDKLLDVLLLREHLPREPIKIDYEVYGAAEAAFGWLNGSFKLTSDTVIALDSFIEDLIMKIDEAVRKEEGEILHLKVSFSAEKGAAKASLVTFAQRVDFLGEIPPPSKKAAVLINVRAKMNPDALLKCVEKAIRNIVNAYKARYSDWSANSFSPAFPKPYYRFSET